MTSENSKQIYKEIIKKFGAEMQELVAIEEMSELTKAIIKLRRKVGDDKKFFAERDNLIEEIADVEIMLEQLKLIHHCSQLVEKKKTQKILRIFSMLED